MIGMKKERLYGPKQRIIGSDQHEGVVLRGEGLLPSPFSYSEKPGKEVKMT